MLHPLVLILIGLAAIALTLNALVTTYDAGVWDPHVTDRQIRVKLWCCILQAGAALSLMFIAGALYA